MNCHSTKGMHEKFIEYNNQFRNTLFDYTVVHVNEIEVIIGMDFDVFEVYYTFLRYDQTDH